MPNISVGPNITASSQIVDGAIMNTDINAAAEIALSKLTTGTQGSVPVRGAGGVLGESGVGSTGQVLTSQGAAATPIWGPAGAFTRGTSTLNTGTTNITHGLGSTPTRIEFSADFIITNGWSSNSIQHQQSETIIASGTLQSTVLTSFSQDATNTFNGSGTSFAGSVTGRVLVNGKYPTITYLVLSAVGSTTFTITWTLGDTGGGPVDSIGSIAMMWKAYA